MTARATLLGNEPVETPAWYRLRSQGLGGSEIAAVVGLSPWQSPYALWRRKHGDIPEQRETRGMSWGKRLEPVVAGYFSELHPEFTPRSGAMYRRGFQIGSPDLMLLDASAEVVALLEVKTADAHDAWSWGPDGTDEIPPYYRCQVLWYLDVLQLPLAYVAVLIGGNDYREYIIYSSVREQAWLRWQGRKFWKSILEHRPPPLDESVHTYEAVRQMHPSINPTDSIEIDIETYESWRDADAETKRLKGVINLSRSRISEEMGEARYGLNFGEKVVIRQSTKGGTPYPKLCPQKGTTP